MPRVNVNIPDELHKQCKLAATAKGLTLKDYILKELEDQL
jgi:predicted HicB family RNase H-like nuclease